MWLSLGLIWLSLGLMWLSLGLFWLSLGLMWISRRLRRSLVVSREVGCCLKDLRSSSILSSARGTLSELPQGKDL